MRRRRGSRSDEELFARACTRELHRVERELRRVGGGPTSRGTTDVPGQVTVIDRHGTVTAIVAVWAGPNPFAVHHFAQAREPGGLPWSVAGYLGIPPTKESGR